MENRPPFDPIDDKPLRKRKTPAAEQNVALRPRGRPALSVLHPGFINTVTRIIEENGFEAHRRRQSTTGSCGITLTDIRDHVLNSEPRIRDTNPSLSLATIHRSLQPPNKKFKAAARYQGHVEAKVPAKRNDAKKQDPNGHYYNARVKYCLEATTMFPNRSMVLSVDNKNKVKVGSTAPAVDRRIKVRRIFPTSDAPNLLDHDFPTPGYLITPSGYLEMRARESTTCEDNLGRVHYKIPAKTAADVLLRGPHDSCTIEAHVQDMLPLVKRRVAEGVQLLVVVADGGPDFNPNHLVNQVYWNRLFRLSGLAGMIVTTYCPGHSAQNPIEHLWAPLTNCLAGVYLKDTLPNEDRPPVHQRQLTQEERLTKEHCVFDRAMDELARYWQGLRWADMSVRVAVVPSGSTKRDKYSDVHQQLNGPAKNLTEGVKGELLDLSTHLDRRIGQLVFSKCPDGCKDCVVDKTDGQLVALLRMLRSFPSPVPSTAYRGHMQTFLDAMALPQQVPDQHMPRRELTSCGRCTICRSYLFTSESGRSRHMRLFHPRK